MPGRRLLFGWRTALASAVCVGFPLATSAQPVSDSDFISIIQPHTGLNHIVISGSQSDTTFAVAVMIDHTTPLRAIMIPLSFAGMDELSIDTSFHETIRALGVTYGPAGSSPPWAARTSLIDNVNKTIQLGFISYATVPPTRDTLCYVHFYLRSGARDLSIQIDTTALPPQNHLAITDSVAVDYVPTWTPLTLTIGSGNFAPVLGAIGSQRIEAGVALSLPVTATDPDGTVPALFASPLPAGAIFEDHRDGTGKFDWTPEATQEGYHSVTFQASDGGIIDSEVVSILVTSTNRPPVLDPIADQSGRVGGPVWIYVHATDPDGTIPTLSAIGIPEDATFTDHGTGRGTFEWVTDWYDNGYYYPTFVASDGMFADTATMRLFLHKTGTYHSDSDFVDLIMPGTGAHDLYLPLDRDTTFLVAVMIKNASPLNFITLPLTFAGPADLAVDASVLTPPDMVGVTYGPAGHVSLWSARTSNIKYDQAILLGFIQYEQFLPHADTLCYIHFRLPATSAPAVVHMDSTQLTPSNSLHLLVLDKGSYMTMIPRWHGFTLHIGNMPPELVHPGDQMTVEGSALCFDVSAADPDGTPPALNASPLPAGATFTDHGDGTGTFDWTPGIAQTGIHPVTFRASDGVLADSETVIITVGATSTGDEFSVLPESFELAQNYPNPFNAATRIRYGLPVASQVRLLVYDALGRHVATLFAGTLPAGWHEVGWDGRSDRGRESGSGVYFIVLETGIERIVRGAVLLK